MKLKSENEKLKKHCFLCLQIQWDGEKSGWPLVTQSYSCVSYVLLWLFVSLCSYEISDAKTRLTHSFLPPTLLLSLNYGKAVKRRSGSRCKDAVGGLCCSRFSPLWAFCIPDAFSVSSCTFEILLLEVGSLLRPRASSVHHGLVITPLTDTQHQADTQTYQYLTF